MADRHTIRGALAHYLGAVAIVATVVGWFALIAWAWRELVT